MRTYLTPMQQRRQEERDHVVRVASEAVEYLAARTTEAQTAKWATTNASGNGIFRWGPNDRLVLLAASTMPTRYREVLYGVEWPGDTARHLEAAAVVSAIAADAMSADTTRTHRVAEAVTAMGVEHEALDEADLAFALDSLASEADEGVRESIAARRYGYGSDRYEAALLVAGMARGLISKPERVVERTRR